MCPNERAKPHSLLCRPVSLRNTAYLYNSVADEDNAAKRGRDGLGFEGARVEPKSVTLTIFLIARALLAAIATKESHHRGEENGNALLTRLHEEKDLRRTAAYFQSHPHPVR